MHRWKVLSVRNNSLSDSASIFIRLAVVVIQTCELVQNSEKMCTYSSSMSSKFDDFDINRKRIGDFLLVVNSNFVPILRRFWDICWKLRIFFLPICHLAPPLRILPLEFYGEFKRQETRVMELLCCEGSVILTLTVFDWSTRVAADGKTDRQTDGRWHI